MDGKVALEEHWAVNETLPIPGQPVAAGAFWDDAPPISRFPRPKAGRDGRTRH